MLVNFYGSDFQRRLYLKVDINRMRIYLLRLFVISIKLQVQRTSTRYYPWVLTVRKFWRRHSLIPFHSYTTLWRSIDNGHRLDEKVLSFVLSRRFINTIINDRRIISTHGTLISVRWLNIIFVLYSCSVRFLEMNTSERQLICVIRILL